MCRFAIYPKFLDSQNLFDDEQLLNFRSQDKRKKVYVLSVVSKFICRNEKRVHESGEKTAEVQNNRNQTSKKVELTRDKKSYYLGFYQLLYKDTVNISMKYYSILVRYCPQDDCDTHFHIEMNQSSRNDDSSRSERQSDRITAIHEMAKYLDGPHKPEVTYDSSNRKLMNLLPEKHLQT